VFIEDSVGDPVEGVADLQPASAEPDEAPQPAKAQATGRAEVASASLPENPKQQQLVIARDPKARKVAIPGVTGLNLAGSADRDRVLAAVLEAMATGRVTPAAGRAYGYIVSVAANDAARELEEQLARALDIIAQLKARLGDRR